MNLYLAQVRILIWFKEQLAYGTLCYLAKVSKEKSKNVSDYLEREFFALVLFQC